MKSDYEFATDEIRRALRQGAMFGVQMAKLRRRIQKRLQKKSLKVDGLDVIRREDGSLYATGFLILNGVTRTLDVYHKQPQPK